MWLIQKRGERQYSVFAGSKWLTVLEFDSDFVLASDCCWSFDVTHTVAVAFHYSSMSMMATVVVG